MSLPQKHQRRPHDEIVAAIIRAASVENRKTRIMYGSALNLKQLNQYLIILVERGFLTHDGKSRTYASTERGLKYLKLHEEMSRARAKFFEKERRLSELLGSMPNAGNGPRASERERILSIGMKVGKSEGKVE